MVLLRFTVWKQIWRKRHPKTCPNQKFCLLFKYISILHDYIWIWSLLCNVDQKGWIFKTFVIYLIFCRIFRALGTPTEATWPGVYMLPEYKSAFPNWQVGDPLLPSLHEEQKSIDVFFLSRAYKSKSRNNTIDGTILNVWRTYWGSDGIALFNWKEILPHLKTSMNINAMHHS